MLAVEEKVVNSELDFENYLSQMEEPDPVKIPSPNPERRNPLNESFEDKCELSEAAKKFLESLNIGPLSKLQRLIFNQLSVQNLVLFRKVQKGGSRFPVCLSLLHRLSTESHRIVLVYKTEVKANTHLNRLRELSSSFKAQSYLSPLNSMILNDKRAVQKPYRFLAFSLPRLVNLINHKSVEFATVSFVLFIETDSILESHGADFDTFVNLYRQKGRETKLGFICGRKIEETSAMLSDYFGGLSSFENRMP